MFNSFQNKMMSRIYWQTKWRLEGKRFTRRNE